MNVKDKRIDAKKLKVLSHTKETRNVSKTCRYFGISRETFYQWKRAFVHKGEHGLFDKKPGMQPGTCPWRIQGELEEKILHLRKTYHLGPQRISWYLMRYHGIKVTGAGVYFVLKRNGMNRLPASERTRSIPTSFTRYEKQVPGHRVEMEAKFLFFRDKSGRRIKRFQYTAIADTSRIRAVKIYKNHTQKNAIYFAD